MKYYKNYIGVNMEEQNNNVEQKVEAEKSTEEFVSFLDYSGISFIKLNKETVTNVGIQKLEKTFNIDTLKENVKEPQINEGQVAKFNVDYLYKFVKFLKEQKKSNLVISLKTDEPLKATSDDITYYLAPIIE